MKQRPEGGEIELTKLELTPRKIKETNKTFKQTRKEKEDTTEILKTI